MRCVCVVCTALRVVRCVFCVCALRCVCVALRIVVCLRVACYVLRVYALAYACCVLRVACCVYFLNKTWKLLQDSMLEIKKSRESWFSEFLLKQKRKCQSVSIRANVNPMLIRRGVTPCQSDVDPMLIRGGVTVRLCQARGRFLQSAPNSTKKHKVVFLSIRCGVQNSPTVRQSRRVDGSLTIGLRVVLESPPSPLVVISSARVPAHQFPNSNVDHHNGNKLNWCTVNTDLKCPELKCPAQKVCEVTKCPAIPDCPDTSGKWQDLVKLKQTEIDTRSNGLALVSVKRVVCPRQTYNFLARYQLTRQKSLQIKSFCTLEADLNKCQDGKGLLTGVAGKLTQCEADLRGKTTEVTKELSFFRLTTLNEKITEQLRSCETGKETCENQLPQIQTKQCFASWLVSEIPSVKR